MVKELNKYEKIIEKVFFDCYEEGARKVCFTGKVLRIAAREYNVSNVPDVLYSFRFRRALPATVSSTADPGKEWIILLDGRRDGDAFYKFVQGKVSNVIPRDDLVTIKIPDATPEIVLANAQDDEQALLAKVRYNRLIDVFLGVSAYSLQNHLRTSIKDVGQIEIDELYVGVDKKGVQSVIPVQAKGGSDKLSIVQVVQDMHFCRERMSNLVCRQISVQFMQDSKIAVFELTVEGEEDDEPALKVVEERHYKLVEASMISPKDLESYQTR